MNQNLNNLIIALSFSLLHSHARSLPPPIQQHSLRFFPPHFYKTYARLAQKIPRTLTKLLLYIALPFFVTHHQTISKYRNIPRKIHENSPWETSFILNPSTHKNCWELLRHPAPIQNNLFPLSTDQQTRATAHKLKFNPDATGAQTSNTRLTTTPRLT